MEATYFPFDTQNCSIKIGSWQYDINMIDLSLEAMSSDNETEITPNPIWDLISFLMKSSW